MTDTEMYDDSSEEDYVRKPKFIQPPKNFATLSEKNVREIERARKTLEQNKTEEKKEKKNKKKLKNIEATQQQITAHVKVPHNEIITKPNAADNIRVPIYQSKNFSTLSEEKAREVQDILEEWERSKEELKDMEEWEQSKEELKDIEVTQEQTTTNTQTAGVEIIHVPSKIDDAGNDMQTFFELHHRYHMALDKFEAARNLAMQKIDTKNILETEGEKQKFNHENQLPPLSPLSLLSPASLISPLSPLSPLSFSAFSDSDKDYTTLPPVTSQMITMEEQDYDHISPRTNIDEESEKVELSKQIDRKKFYVDSLSKLLTDFNEMKEMLNINIIKIMELLEESNKLLGSESK